MPVIRLRMKGKCLKVTTVGREASMARTMGARNSGAESAWTDLAKQKEVIASIVQQRRPKKMSDDWLDRLFSVRTRQK